MLTVYVDANACPVKAEVYRVARRHGLRVAVVADAPLWVPADPLVEPVVRPGFGGADDRIAQEAGPGDIVVTADIPLAARCLARGGRVLDPKGRPFTDNDIGVALALRELKVVRRRCPALSMRCGSERLFALRRERGRGDARSGTASGAKGLLVCRALWFCLVIDAPLKLTSGRGGSAGALTEVSGPDSLPEVCCVRR
jgi:uncharacterized protein YaiI (UPF0178 family)